MAYFDCELIPRPVRAVFRSAFEFRMAGIEYLVREERITIPDDEARAKVEAFVFLGLMLDLVIGPLESMGAFYVRLCGFDLDGLQIGATRFDARTARINRETIDAFWALCARAQIQRNQLRCDDVEAFARTALQHSWEAQEGGDERGTR